MKYIFMIMLLGAIWLLSASEQGVIGSWGYWTSLGIAGAIVVCQLIVDHLSRRGVEVMQYWTCPECGANLDPGEKCDCEKNKKCPVRVEPRDGTNNK